MSRFDAPRLTVVTDRAATGDRPLDDVLAAALGAGLPAVQLRAKELDGRAFLRLAERLRRLTADHGARLFINDRVDVALAVGADGAHLPRTSFPVETARGLLGHDRAVGESTHALDEVGASAADYLFFGPVFDTPSKRAFGPPHGTGPLAEAAAAAPAPLIAIGGIDATTAAACRTAGAHGVAVIRAVLAAADPAVATAEILGALAPASA